MRRTLLGTSIVAFLMAVAYLAEATRYPRGTMAHPSAGVFPLAVGALMLIAALATGLEARSRKTWEDVEWPRGSDALRVLAMLGASLGYAVLLPYLGHPVAGTLVTLAVLQMMHLKGRVLKLVLSLVIGLGSHYLFAVVLGVPLPIGIWLR
jgi:putative tricarboxylic transport membrane protein